MNCILTEHLTKLSDFIRESGDIFISMHFTVVVVGCIDLSYVNVQVFRLLWCKNILKCPRYQQLSCPWYKSINVSWMQYQIFFCCGKTLKAWKWGFGFLVSMQLCLCMFWLSRFCLVNQHPCDFPEINGRPAVSRKMSSVWIRVHSRNYSNANSFVWEMNGLEAFLIYAERVGAPACQRNLSYLQENELPKIFKMTKKKKRNHTCECDKRRQRISKRVCFSSLNPPLSASASACQSAWPWGCWPAGGVVSRSSSTASGTCRQ